MIDRNVMNHYDGRETEEENEPAKNIFFSACRIVGRIGLVFVGK